jgi:hypothetical protein
MRGPPITVVACGRRWILSVGPDQFGGLAGRGLYHDVCVMRHVSHMVRHGNGVFGGVDASPVARNRATVQGHQPLVPMPRHKVSCKRHFSGLRVAASRGTTFEAAAGCSMIQWLPDERQMNRR